MTNEVTSVQFGREKKLLDAKLTASLPCFRLFRLQEPPDHVRLEDVAGQMNFLMMDKDRIQTRENSRYSMPLQIGFSRFI